MYVPSMLTTPLNAVGPIDPTKPTESVTSEWAFLDGPLQIGIWECTPGRFTATTGEYDEAMCMVSGRVTVDHDGASFDIAPGTLWTTPRNWPSTWTVHQTVRKLYVIDHRSGAAGEATYLANAYAAPLPAPTERPGATEGRPMEAADSLWEHNRLDVGRWECSPGRFPFRRDGYQEVFTILSGRATLHVDGGPSFELVPGSMLLTPSGTTGEWVVHETVRKAYVTILDEA